MNLDSTEKKSGNVQSDKLPKDIPEALLYGIKVARVDVGQKMAGVLRKLSWPDTGIIKIGWKAADVPFSEGLDEKEWLHVTGLAARLFHEHLTTCPEWTYSVTTCARGKGLNQ